MALAATRVEPWILVSDRGGLRIVKHIDNKTDEKMIIGWLEESEHSTLVIKRQFHGLTNFTKQIGTRSNTFSYQVGNGITLTFTTAGQIDAADQFVCTADGIDLQDHVTGHGWQTQTWERHSKVQQIEDSYYEESVT